MPRPLAKLGLLFIFLLAGASLYAAGRRFIVGDLTDPAQGEEIAFVWTASFYDLYLSKVNNLSSPGVPRFVIPNFTDPGHAEEIAFACNQDVADAWNDLVDISTPGTGPRFFISDLADPNKAQENITKMNALLDDLFTGKQDL